MSRYFTPSTACGNSTRTGKCGHQRGAHLRLELGHGDHRFVHSVLLQGLKVTLAEQHHDEALGVPLPPLALTRSRGTNGSARSR